MGLPEGVRIIHAFVGGSGLHGIKLEGRDDTDIYATFIEKPEDALGLERLDHFVTSTAPVSQRNKAGDIDVTCYSLRRWAALAAAGNPRILHFLFAPADLALNEIALYLAAVILSSMVPLTDCAPTNDLLRMKT